MAVEDRIWKYVDKESSPTGCWTWTGTLNHLGYGWVRDFDCPRYAHRIVWRLLRGDVPDGLELDHLCRVRACVNPEHLEPVTHAENMRRSSKAHLGTCRNGHPVNAENSYISPRGRHNCRPCERQSKKKLRARGGAA